MSKNIKAIIIGGSAGSFTVVANILRELPKNFNIPIIMCLHRLKHIREGFVEALQLKSNLPVVEPYDKEKIKAGVVYLAPANYHMLVEYTQSIGLSTEGMVNFSRPSIDLTFQTAAAVYRSNCVGIILSGANRDGAKGLKFLKEYGGVSVIQKPEECKVDTMPKAAKAITTIDYEFTTDQIIDYLKQLNT